MKRPQFGSDEEPRHEAGDRIPAPLAPGLGLRLAALAINGVALTPTIVFRVGGARAFMVRAAFASVLACGISAILQGVRVGRIGAGAGVPPFKSSSRFHSPVQTDPVKRQKPRIVQSCMTLGDFLPGFASQAIRRYVGGPVPVFLLSVLPVPLPPGFV